MSIKKKKFYITTPIYYASGEPHIGHAFTTILADVIAKYKKLIGYDVVFLTGMDEHGQKIAEKAAENNMEPQKWVDFITDKFLDLWKKLDINNTNFIRTSSPKHKLAVQKVFSEFLIKKYIYLGQWESLYCVGCEETYTKDEAIKKEDGHLYCRIGHKLINKKEPSYFFKMSKFTDWIKKFLLNNKNFLYPKTRVNEMINSFINQGIEDLSVSRTNFKWGIPIIENKEHVIYVWIDALLNYLTALGYKQSDQKLFKKIWGDKKTEIVHLMSKEITRFHCIYWPIMLKCLNVREPSKVISHGWIVTKEGKMSKSLGNVVDPKKYLEEFGSDPLRYYLTKEINIENDGVFSRDLFIGIFNNDLANTYGNLVSRFIGMCIKFNNRIIKKENIKLDAETSKLVKAMKNTFSHTKKFINNFEINKLLKSILELGEIANKYIEIMKPWNLAKENKTKEINNFIFYLANVIRMITILLSPVLTNGTKKIVEQMNFNTKMLKFSNILKFDLLNNHKISEKTEPIYMRIEIEKNKN